MGTSTARSALVLLAGCVTPAVGLDVDRTAMPADTVSVLLCPVGAPNNHPRCEKASWPVFTRNDQVQVHVDILIENDAKAFRIYMSDNAVCFPTDVHFGDEVHAHYMAGDSVLTCTPASACSPSTDACVVLP